ncbi:MAG: shikimate dehydrogenase [Pseudomonadales bacterium]
MDQYAVFGNPVAHSKSPLIHRLFAEQTGEPIEYSTQLVEPEAFASTARAFFASGGKGVNITLPFKQDAWRFADYRSPHAERAGAVNTLAVQADGRLYGANTDGTGLLKDISNNLGWQVESKRLLLIGAGGAGRGVLQPLLQAGPRSLTIVNRTANKATELAREFGDFGPINASSFNALQGEQFDLLINATAASLQGELPPLPDDILSHESRAYDMLYATTLTPFNAWAKQNGARQVADGLGMLVEQAAESFFIWRAVRPDTTQLIKTVRVALEQDVTAS